MEAFLQSMKEKHAALNEQAAELRVQNRGDEAVFCTVRANVYDICATVCGVHMKRGDPAAVETILARFQKEWTAALEAAKRQDNAKKICVEETKLEALADVTARWTAARCE